MLTLLKEIALGTVCALCLYAMFGGYIVAMFNGKLPFMQHNEPKQMCVVFQDGTKYGLDSVISIDAYHEKTGQSFEMVECK
ncbi:hypothetical protein [Shewanella sp.]|uniref:hypothetical protein n=1 Tax=Shewanella sp. TaxID=50422 RepID=UPI001B4F9F2C|nr:hypothetical protein [Shewanella sp.]MBP6517882.1 hypothetical protein [Shewanella sp.]